MGLSRFTVVLCLTLVEQCAFTPVMTINQSNSVINYSTDNFSVIIKKTAIDGKCVEEIVVSGQIINDTFKTSCTNSQTGIFMNGNIVVVGDPNTSPLALFSDSPDALIIMADGKCTKKTYQKAMAKTTTPVTLGDEECDKIKKRIQSEKEKNRIYWKNWAKKFTENLKKSFPKGFPFVN